MAHPNKPKMKLKYKLRFLLLVHLLRNHDFYFPRTEFDLSDWVRQNPHNHAACGTAACAVGSAALWWPFNLMGLTYDRLCRAPAYKNLHHWSATEDFFGISGWTAMWLFGSGAYRYAEDGATADDVADRILQYLKEGRPND